MGEKYTDLNSIREGLKVKEICLSHRTFVMCVCVYARARVCVCDKTKKNGNPDKCQLFHIRWVFWNWIVELKSEERSCVFTCILGSGLRPRMPFGERWRETVIGVRITAHQVPSCCYIYWFLNVKLISQIQTWSISGTKFTDYCLTWNICKYVKTYQKGL